MVLQFAKNETSIDAARQIVTQYFTSYYSGRPWFPSYLMWVVCDQPIDEVVNLLSQIYYIKSGFVIINVH